MPTCVVFDCESDGLPPRVQDEHGRVESDFSNVHCTVACALVLDSEKLPDLEHGRKLTCWRDVAPSRGVDPFARLLAEFDDADVIVAFNGFDFDFPLLKCHYKCGRGGEPRYHRHLAKCHDLFTRVRGATERWFKLDTLLALNGIPGKSSSGAMAVQMWYDGRREQLEQYCATDVRRTAQLALLPELRWGATPPLPATVFGLVPAVRAAVAP